MRMPTRLRTTNFVSRVQHAQRGAAIVEFALVAPVFLLILLGIIAYGGYFWRAHSLQQVANDAARSALAGLDPTERSTLARLSVAQELGPLAGLHAERAAVSISEANETLVVTLDYDASHDAFLQFGLVPLPQKRIRRTAAIRLGGL
ncbi:TadE/TadG family type IV pilus assembly protein [Sphingomonas sp. KC8]|uniref:TadE/TadG family type IV pilus assembly protein n=1 Tax=Sphingomonas sp. KC8 TaxID=1030157 RepID=UPI000A31E0B3|nr:TadE/TadG family type IV pilus assembly protein [Sphingomonas sp. KC8]ARS26347.1 TadE-like protein [Sphingomonas sp. KC8]